MIVIGSGKCAEVHEFRIELGGNGIWVYHNDGYFSATADAWREIIRQVSAVLEPAKVDGEDVPVQRYEQTDETLDDVEGAL